MDDAPEADEEGVPEPVAAALRTTRYIQRWLQNVQKTHAAGEGEAPFAAGVAGVGMSLGVSTANAAPDVVNRTYNDARRMIQQSGGKAVIATRTGAALEDGKCLVMNAWDVWRGSEFTDAQVNREMARLKEHDSR